MNFVDRIFGVNVSLFPSFAAVARLQKSSAAARREARAEAAGRIDGEASVRVEKINVFEPSERAGFLHSPIGGARRLKTKQEDEKDGDFFSEKHK